MSLHAPHPFALAAAVLVAVAAALIVESPGPSAAPTVERPPRRSRWKRRSSAQVDTIRPTAKLATTRHSAELTNAAEGHAATLARSGAFAHEVPGQKPFSLRLQSYYARERLRVLGHGREHLLGALERLARRR